MAGWERWGCSADIPNPGKKKKEAGGAGANPLLPVQERLEGIQGFSASARSPETIPQILLRASSSRIFKNREIPGGAGGIPALSQLSGKELGHPEAKGGKIHSGLRW